MKRFPVMMGIMRLMKVVEQRHGAILGTWESPIEVSIPDSRFSTSYSLILRQQARDRRSLADDVGDAAQFALHAHLADVEQRVHHRREQVRRAEAFGRGARCRAIATADDL